MFYKSFPTKTEFGINWEEVYLLPKDENSAISQADQDNVRIMQKSLQDAKEILSKNNFKLMQTNVVNIATQLFSKRADHNVFYKERKCREIYDRIRKNRDKRETQEKN